MSRLDPSNVTPPDDYSQLASGPAQVAPPADVFAVPTVLDMVRSAPPSDELVAFLVSSTLDCQRRGAHSLAADLLSLALCARSALRENRPLG